MKIAQLDSRDKDFSVRFTALTHRAEASDARLQKKVARMLGAVRNKGIVAVLKYARKYDAAQADSLEMLRVDQARLDASLAELSQPQRDALELATERIQAFHQHQQSQDWEYTDEQGVRLGQLVRPVRSVGIYVPGGRAAYPSTVLMNTIPARVAGVERIVMVSPAASPATVPAPVLAAAKIAGVSEVYALGGVQAIAMLAYGCESFAKVDKIVGPGNAYVAMAKRLVYADVGIDSIAGPSEVLIISDAATKSRWAALDLFAQAEHDPLAQTVLISPDSDWLKQVHETMCALLPEQPRKKIIRESLQNRGALIVVQDLEEAVQLANDMAPEHLQLAVAEPEALLQQIRNTGAVFLGAHASEALGDYLAGSNHVLPTAGTARYASPLGVYDFLKRTAVIGCTPDAASTLAPSIATLARMEGLEAHAQAAEARVEKKS